MDTVLGVLVLVVVAACVYWAIHVTGYSLPILNGVQSEGTILAWRDTGMMESHGAGSLG